MACNGQSQVATAQADSYSPTVVRGAVGACIDRLPGLQEVLRSAGRVLLKPNLLSSRRGPESHINTHPSVVQALAEILRSDFGCHVTIGDSCGSFSAASTANAIRNSRMDEAAEKAGAEIYNVDAQPRRVVACDDAEVFWEILLPANLSEFDLILSIPKLKTHQLTYITCAVKNLFGLMPGAAKKQAHMLAPRPDEFAALLCDLFGLVRPQAAFVDGIVGMEGNGPNNGKLRHAGMVAASADCVALDSVCAQVMGMDPLRVPLLAQCEQRKLGTADPGLITVLGDPPAAFAPPNFKKPPAYASRLLLQSIPRRTVRALLGATSTVHARIDQSTCQRCGECARNCPSGAITLNPRTKRYNVNSRKCISCYCCDEVCPFDSIRMQPTHFRRILDGARRTLSLTRRREPGPDRS